jgi:predicted DNA-binding protein with PD1-like motif
VIGGHLKEGSIVHTTVELVLAVDDSLRFSEENDPDTGFGELKIEKI